MLEGSLILKWSGPKARVQSTIISNKMIGVAFWQQFVRVSVYFFSKFRMNRMISTVSAQNHCRISRIEARTRPDLQGFVRNDFDSPTLIRFHAETMNHAGITDP